MTSKFQLLINGKGREGSEGVAVDVVNPATGESIGKVAYGSRADIEEAIETAYRGLQNWQAVPAWERGGILKDAAGITRSNSDPIAEMLTLKQGKILAQARDEVHRAADFVEWGGEQARRVAGRIVPGRQAGQRIEVQPHPIGVVAALTPWNLTDGACCEEVCRCACRWMRHHLQTHSGNAWLRAGLGRGSSAIGRTPGSTRHHFRRRQSGVDTANRVPPSKITFTGSIPVGKRLAAAAGLYMKPVTMELGGHAPVVVCRDADPEATAELLARAKFTNAGQICLCPSRFFVEESIAERFAAPALRRSPRD